MRVQYYPHGPTCSGCSRANRAIKINKSIYIFRSFHKTSRNVNCWARVSNELTNRYRLMCTLQFLRGRKFCWLGRASVGALGGVLSPNVPRRIFYRVEISLPVRFLFEYFPVNVFTSVLMLI